MSIINTALIGKLKKTKADKTNVLQKDNTGAYVPTSDYHPSTKKYVDDNKLKSIVDASTYSLYDDHTSSSANDLSTIIGPVSSVYTKNYDKSLFLQDQSLVLNPGNIQLPVTIEGWVFYNDNTPSLSTIFEIGGDIGNGNKQSISIHADGSAYYTDTTGINGLTSTPASPFIPQAAWVHYALYVSETTYAVWVNGSRKLTGSLGVWADNNNYAQSIARTYFAYGSARTTNALVAPNCFYDSIRISSGDIYGAGNTSITVPGTFVNNGTTRHLFHIASVQNAQVVNAMFINPPTALNNPATKQYVDSAIAAIPGATDTFTSGGYVTGNTLILNQNTGQTVNINVSALLDDTTNTITSGVLNGNSILFTRQDGSTFSVDVHSLYDDTNLVTSVNGQTGAITINDKYVTSGAVSGNTLTLTNNDGSTVNINVASLNVDTDNYVDAASLNGHILTLGRSGTLPDLTVDLSSIAGTTDTNDYVDSVSLNGTTLTLGRTGTLPDLTVDLVSLRTVDNDNYVDTVSLNGNILTLGRTGSLSDLTVDLSSLITIDTDNYVDDASLNGNILTLGRSGSLPDLTVDLSSLSGTGAGNVINVFSRREKQKFTATAGQTAFLTTLDLIDVEVFYNGFKLDPTDYTISGNTVTLLEAAQVGDNIEVIDYGSEDLTGETFVTGTHEPSTPAIGTVWQDTRSDPVIKIWNGTSWVVIGDISTSYNKRKFEIATPTSTFNVGYTIGLVEVFINGLKLADTEYTAINGTTVELVTPALVGDYVEIIVLTPISSGIFYSKDEVDALIGNISLTNYYTKTEVNTLISNINLTNYYTKAQVDQMIAGAGTGSSTTSGLTSQVIDTFSTNDYRSGEYLLMVSGNSGFMSLKMMVLFNDSTALNTQYAQLGADLGTFDTIVQNGIVEVLFTPIDNTSVVQFSRTLIENLTPSAPSSLPSDLNSGSGTVDLNSGSGTLDMNGTYISGDLNSGSGTLDMLSGSGTTDLNQ